MARARKDQEIMRLHRKAEKSGEEELLRDVLDESPIKAPSHEDTVLKALSIEGMMGSSVAQCFVDRD